ncbi:MAG: type II secretion system protein [Candidatus Omnitrophica bacterium]|nr:type II secretion system protein [Candidatus Omnitrophota bacterium]
MNLKYGKLRSENGVSLIEVLVAMVIAFVIFLSIGVISKISISTHTKYCNETRIYADISYGFKLIQKHIREANIVNPPDAPGAPWIGSRIVVAPDVGNYHVFGLYQNTDSVDFVYLKDITDENDRVVILSVPNTGTVTLTLTPGVKLFEVRIQGEKGGVPFDMSTMIMRRA